MADYKEMYLTMVRETEKAITLVEQAHRTLITAQRDCEEMYINSPEPVIRMVNSNAQSKQDECTGSGASGVVYTEAEKQKINNILKAFEGFIKEQNYFDIMYSEKIGYFYIMVNPCDMEPARVIRTAEELMDTLFYEVIAGVVYSPENQRIDKESSRLSEHEEAASRRRLTEIVEKIEEDREYWLNCIDLYLRDYQERYTD